MENENIQNQSKTKKIIFWVAAILGIVVLGFFASKNTNLFKAALFETNTSQSTDLIYIQHYEAQAGNPGALAIKVGGSGFGNGKLAVIDMKFYYNSDEIIFDPSPLTFLDSNSSFAGQNGSSIVQTIVNDDGNGTLHIGFYTSTPYSFSPLDTNDNIIFGLGFQIPNNANPGDIRITTTVEGIDVTDANGTLRDSGITSIADGIITIVGGASGELNCGTYGQWASAIGECVCDPGFAQPTCISCAEGYVGPFPDCTEETLGGLKGLILSLDPTALDELSASEREDAFSSVYVMINSPDADGSFLNIVGEDPIPINIPLCGDGIKDPIEECDDGNTDNNDGCSSLCITEYCGDGIPNNNAIPGTETCDDGNTITESCLYGEINCAVCGANCMEASGAPVSYCGDKVKNGPEECDDDNINNLNNNDDCANCMFAVCGDGFIQSGVDICDDGNNLSNDGCTGDTCTLESGFTCETGEPTVCTPLISGDVMAWGANFYMQLGNESVSEYGSCTDDINCDPPVDVIIDSSDPSILSNSISAGVYHACAITDIGDVRCWGRIFENATGIVCADDTAICTLPTVIPELTGSDMAVAISAGGHHTCALTTNGEVKCWGRNEFGQLGNGLTEDILTPVYVATASGNPLNEINSIAAGLYHTCVLTTSGNVKCWGEGTNGTLGDGDVNNSLTPVDVVNLSGVKKIASGYHNTCAIGDFDDNEINGNEVKCWGKNDEGQLGNGTDIDSPTPVIVPGLSYVKDIVISKAVCALTTDGEVKCWGPNDLGQLGDGTISSSNIPVSVRTSASDITPLNGVSAISAGTEYACAVMAADGSLKCWGDNNKGQLGDGGTLQRLAPVDVIGLSGEVTAIATGSNSTYAITAPYSGPGRPSGVPGTEPAPGGPGRPSDTEFIDPELNIGEIASKKKPSFATARTPAAFADSADDIEAIKDMAENLAFMIEDETNVAVSIVSGMIGVLKLTAADGSLEGISSTSGEVIILPGMESTITLPPNGSYLLKIIAKYSDGSVNDNYLPDPMGMNWVVAPPDSLDMNALSAGFLEMGDESGSSTVRIKIPRADGTFIESNIIHVTVPPLAIDDFYIEGLDNIVEIGGSLTIVAKIRSATDISDITDIVTKLPGMSGTNITFNYLLDLAPINASSEDGDTTDSSGQPVKYRIFEIPIEIRSNQDLKLGDTTLILEVMNADKTTTADIDIKIVLEKASGDVVQGGGITIADVWQALRISNGSFEDPDERTRKAANVYNTSFSDEINIFDVGLIFQMCKQNYAYFLGIQEGDAGYADVKCPTSNYQ